MEVYSVYKFKSHPEWLILVLSFAYVRGATEKANAFEGIAFNLEGKYDTFVFMDIPSEYELVGYLQHRDNATFTLELKKV